jgi:hypothetical protein
MHAPTTGRRRVAATILATTAVLATIGVTPAAHAGRPASLEISASVVTVGSNAEATITINRGIQATRNLFCNLTPQSTGAILVVDCGTPSAQSKSGPTIYRTTLENLPAGDYVFSAVIAAKNAAPSAGTTTFTIEPIG